MRHTHSLGIDNIQGTSGGRFAFLLPIRGQQIFTFSPTPSHLLSFPISQALCAHKVFVFLTTTTPPLMMVGSGLKCKCEASSITEKEIKNLRSAGYLITNIVHKLPPEGQVIPTLKPGEWVVFLPHFLRGLGFPLHPFVCGLMYYYGLDFHDLARTHSSTSRHSSSCVRLSSASTHTSAYGSRSST